MKKIIPAFILLLFIACKKQDQQIPVTYPDAWGMVGTVNETDFNATSLNASFIYDSTTHLYELNVNGWKSTTDETIYLSYSGVSILTGTYILDNVTTPVRYKTWAFYQKDHKDIMYCEGYINIHSIADSLVKGGYDLTTADKKHIKGVFTVKPNYVIENGNP